MAEDRRQEGQTRSRTHRLVRHPLLWLMLVAAIIGAAWTAATPSVLRRLGAPVEAVAGLLNRGATDHVIVISIDGLRPDAIERFGAPTLQRLMRKGRFTLRATTIIPPKTLPSHSSMLTGTQPAVHGITWNEDQTGEHGYVKVPTIFGIARRRGLETAAFFSKTKFEHLALPADFDYLQRPQGGILSLSAGFVSTSVTEYLEEHEPNLLFVHIADVDFIGHRVGWMSWMYGRALQSADAAVNVIVEQANKSFGCGNYTIIVTADHGGHGRNHGVDQPSDMLIPWITAGKAVTGFGVLADSINTTDTGATALWLLGVDPPPHITGRVNHEAYAEPILPSPSILEAPAAAVQGCL